jgi:hypothetical protein
MNERRVAACQAQGLRADVPLNVISPVAIRDGLDALRRDRE